ncbi:FAD-dependent oxidoreductase (plasmid) [Agrobacterium leguminum]|uniref:FAD dependent oxidoreductase n=1 Tax=Agrobacterium deltaense NCPPB 1641 TaxID=1183425 RepID=A0A1S7UAC8_9HYPH
MRTNLPGISDQRRMISFTFEDRSIKAFEGDTIAAAMSAEEIVTLRKEPKGTPRGVYCGMGVCQDCIVDVEGVGKARACMTKVADGMVVGRSRQGRQPVVGQARFESDERSVDTLVVGGGPAGIAAATALAVAGVDTLLIDERHQLGGQYFKQPAEPFTINVANLDRQFRSGREKIARLMALGPGVMLGTTLWGTFSGNRVAVSSASKTTIITYKRLIIATGAYERSIPISGWTLPGSMTTGAVQTLLRSSQIVPGKRFFVTGNGPLNLQVAYELVKAGARVVGVAEAGHPISPRSVFDVAALARYAPDLAVDGLRYLSLLTAKGVPIHFGQAVVAAEGNDRVERVHLAKIDENGKPHADVKVVSTDILCAGYGFNPSNEIARALGCEHTFDHDRSVLVPVRDDSFRSSLSDVWIVGDCAGLGGARAAMASGAIAGIAAARGATGQVGHAESELRAERTKYVRATRFQERLWRAYHAPALGTKLAGDQTLICRCESVSLGDLEQACRSGVQTIGAVKRLTRAGMGPCQGRFCSHNVAQMVHERTGAPITEFSLFAPRLPFKPQPISAFEALANRRDDPLYPLEKGAPVD